MSRVTSKILHDAFVFFVVFLSVWLFPDTNQAATFCVSTATSLQAALRTAAHNGEDDLIQIIQGTYAGGFLYDSPEAFRLTIEGGYAAGCTSRRVDPTATVLDGMGGATVLVLTTNQSADFVVDGLTFQNGKATTFRHLRFFAGAGWFVGAGLFVDTQGALTLTQSILSRNSIFSTAGGGSYIANASTVTLTDNTIRENAAGFGGGVAIVDVGTVVLTTNTLSANGAGASGGGVYIDGADTVILTGNVIHRNYGDFSPSGGGGVSVVNATAVTLTGNIIRENSVGFAAVGSGVALVHTSEVTLIGNLISGNTLSGNKPGAHASGGGVAVVSANTAVLSNNTISNNTARPHGGGGFFDDVNLVTLTNNTLIGNTAEFGGGISLILASDTARADIYNNIIWNNRADGVANDLNLVNDQNRNGVASLVNLFNNDFQQTPSRGILLQVPFRIDVSNLDNVNPRFVDAASDDYHLQADSPLINKGANEAPALPTTDQDGGPRIFDGIVDIGAFESPRQASPPAPSPPVSSPTSTLEGGRSGGGCAINPEAGFDPVLMSLLGFLLAFLRWKRARSVRLSARPSAAWHRCG